MATKSLWLGVRQAEDAGVVGAPHHDLMFLTRSMAAGALGARSLGAVALPGHSIAGVSHGCAARVGGHLPRCSPSSRDQW